MVMGFFGSYVRELRVYVKDFANIFKLEVHKWFFSIHKDLDNIKVQYNTDRSRLIRVGDTAVLFLCFIVADNTCSHCSRVD